MAEFDLKIAAIERHQQFVRRSVSSGVVWVLQLKDPPHTWATSTFSFEDEGGEEAEAPVVPVWSDRAYAKRCAKGPWSVYEPRSIPLVQFVDCVLKDMHEKEVLVGTNWSGDLIGDDTSAVDLAYEISEAMERVGLSDGA